MALDDDLGRAAGSGVPFKFNGEDLVFPPITMEILGELRQWLLTQRKSPQAVLAEHLESLGDKLTPELVEKMVESSMAAARKLAIVSDEEFAAYIDTLDGLAMSIWLALDRRYPKRFTKDDVVQIVKNMDRQGQEKLFRVRDQAAGMDELGNSTGRTPE